MHEEDEQVMTAEDVAKELGPEPGVVDHETEAAAAEPAPDQHDRPPEVSGLLAELSKLRGDRRAMRDELAALKANLDERNKELEDRLKPVGEFVSRSEREKAERARLESAPDPDQDPRGYALWAMRQETEKVVAPVQDRIGKVEEYLEKITQAIEIEQQQQQQSQEARQAFETTLHAINVENSRMTPQQLNARNSFLARRTQDYVKAGLDEQSATAQAADDLRDQYRQAFDRHGEVGHGGEYLESAMRAWGWEITAQPQPSADERPASPAPPPDIARRQRQQRLEQPPAASARSSSGNDGWAEFKRNAPELARNNPTAFEAKLGEFARKRGVSEDELERELVA